MSDSESDNDNENASKAADAPGKSKKEKKLDKAIKFASKMSMVAESAEFDPNTGAKEEIKPI